LDVDANMAAVASVRVRAVDLNDVECFRVVDDDDGLVDLGGQAHQSDLHDRHTSPQSPHSSACSSLRSRVFRWVSLMVSVLPQAGQAVMAASWAVKSATVANPSLPMHSAQRQYPEVEG